MKYRRKPEVVQAWSVTGLLGPNSVFPDALDSFVEHNEITCHADRILVYCQVFKPDRAWSYTDIVARPGDVIVLLDDRHLQVVDGYTFEQQYEPIGYDKHE